MTQATLAEGIGWKITIDSNGHFVYEDPLTEVWLPEDVGKAIIRLRELLTELAAAAAAYRQSHSTWKEVSDSMLRIDSAIAAAKEAL